MRRLAAFVLCAAVGCSNGAAEPRPTAAPPPATTTAPAPTASPAESLPEWGELDGICQNVSDGRPPLLPPVAAHVLGVEQTVSTGRNYGNADSCTFTPRDSKTPSATVFVGRPESSEWDRHAQDPTRVDEPSLPGGAYSFVDGAATTVVLRLATGELAVTVQGLAEGDRAAAVRFARILLALAWEA